MSERVASTYIGQVERDPTGTLWAVLYFHDQVIEQQPVRSLRHGKRLVANMVLAAADAFPDDPGHPLGFRSIAFGRATGIRSPSTRDPPIRRAAMSSRALTSHGRAAASSAQGESKCPPAQTR